MHAGGASCSPALLGSTVDVGLWMLFVGHERVCRERLPSESGHFAWSLVFLSASCRMFFAFLCLPLLPSSPLRTLDLRLTSPTGVAINFKCQIRITEPCFQTLAFSAPVHCYEASVLCFLLGAPTVCCFSRQNSVNHLSAFIIARSKINLGRAALASA